MKETTIYTRKLCGFCAMAKRLLNDKGIEFVERDATFRPDVKSEMVRRAHGRATFPQIFIDGHHVGGFDDLHALDKTGQLDSLLAAHR